MEVHPDQLRSKGLEILEAAARYFLSHGYQGTSISVMARDEGISKESIYRYFRSKQVLFEAVLAKELTEYRQRLKFLDSEPGREGLRVALNTAAESILSAVSTERALALRRLVFEAAKETPQVGAYYYDIGPREAYRHLSRTFEKHRTGARLGPETLARNFVAQVLHYDMLRLECGVAGPLSRSQIKARARKCTEEFLEVNFR